MHETIEFKGKVVSIEQLGKRAVKALLVDFDPRFLLTVRIGSVSGTGAPFQEADDQAFAIHSPSRMFAADNSVGKTLAFVLEKTVDHGQTTWRLALKR